MESGIQSVAISTDNQKAFISDHSGNIKIIKWKPEAGSIKISGHSEEENTKVGNNLTYSICLTKDEKYLLVGSDGLVSLFETETREVTKEYIMQTCVVAIKLIKNGKKALIAEENGNLSIIDLENFEMFLVAENTVNHPFVQIAIV